MFGITYNLTCKMKRIGAELIHFGDRNDIVLRIIKAKTRLIEGENELNHVVNLI